MNRISLGYIHSNAAIACKDEVRPLLRALELVHLVPPASLAG